MSEYIVIWKEAPGQQVSTVVDAHDVPVRRSTAYLMAQDIPVLDDLSDVLTTLEHANGRKIAVEPELARSALGWDL